MDRYLLIVMEEHTRYIIKNGNRLNNDITNLTALSIQDHYDIHYKQNDWGACLAISMRMKKSSKEIAKIQSEIGKKSAFKRKENGTNPFCFTGEKHHRYGKKHSKETIDKIKEKRAKQVMSLRPDLRNLFSKEWKILFPNGKYEIVINLKMFCKENNLHYASMAKVGNGQLKSHKGFKCEKLRSNDH